jgi:hypothetical protein
MITVRSKQAANLLQVELGTRSTPVKQLNVAGDVEYILRGDTAYLDPSFTLLDIVSRTRTSSTRS